MKKDSIKNVKAKLYCASSPDTPLHTQKLDTVKFVIFPSIPADGTNCWINVEVRTRRGSAAVLRIRINIYVLSYHVFFMASSMDKREFLMPLALNHNF